LCSAKELFAVGATSNESKLKNFAIAVDRDSPISVFINRFPLGFYAGMYGNRNRVQLM